MGRSIPVYERILAKADRWGRVRRIHVWWKPLGITYTDPGYENVGRRLTAFDGPDACPVGLIVSNVTCDVRLRENMVEHNGHVVALTRVTSRSRLKAGTYYIEEGGID